MLPQKEKVIIVLFKDLYFFTDKEKEMKNIDTVNKAKEVKIYDYLSKKGINPSRSTGNMLVYFSPIREEHTASFFVDTESNKFKDFGEESFRGDILDLVQRLENCSLPKAVEILKDFENSPLPPSFSLSVKDSSKKSQIISVKPLMHKALINYANSRKISFETVFKYCKEIHYKVDEKTFFSIGFKNDAGGYATRNQLEGGKNCIAPNTFSIIEGFHKNKVVNLFEGFFDFLSALEYYRLTNPHNTTIVLNSTENLSKALPTLKTFDKINLFLDNDKGGDMVKNRLKKEGLLTIDYSYIYLGFNDFNQFLKSSKL